MSNDFKNRWTENCCQRIVDVYQNDTTDRTRRLRGLSLQAPTGCAVAGRATIGRVVPGN